MKKTESILDQRFAEQLYLRAGLRPRRSTYRLGRGICYALIFITLAGTLWQCWK